MKVLLVRFSAIGDCVMAAHTASCIRRSYPEGTLVWAMEERCAPVVDDKRLVSGKAIYPRERWKRGTWSPKTWREQMRFYAKLRSFGFDVGLDLQGHSKTAICLRLSKAKRRLSLRATDPLAGLLNPVLNDFGGAKHTVERQLFALRTTGDFPGDPAPPIMPEPVNGPDLRKPYVCIAVGAGQPWKAYPHFDEVGRTLTDSGLHVVFIGGQGERSPAVGTDLVAKLDLFETMAVIKRSAVTIAADTGAGHIAAAYGVPVVSIFGPTDPAEFRPYTSKGIVLKEGAETALVEPEKVVEAAGRMLECAS